MQTHLEKGDNRDEDEDAVGHPCSGEGWKDHHRHEQITGNINQIEGYDDQDAYGKPTDSPGLLRDDPDRNTQDTKNERGSREGQVFVVFCQAAEGARIRSAGLRQSRHDLLVGGAFFGGGIAALTQV